MHPSYFGGEHYYLQAKHGEAGARFVLHASLSFARAINLDTRLSCQHGWSSAIVYLFVIILAMLLLPYCFGIRFCETYALLFSFGRIDGVRPHRLRMMVCVL